MSEWISVKERLPEVKRVSYSDFRESEFVLIRSLSFVPGKVCYDVAQYTVPFKSRLGHWDTRSGDTIDNVTHWMPLPDPPKEKP